MSLPGFRTNGLIAFYNNLCLDVYTTDRTMGTLNLQQYNKEKTDSPKR